MSAAISFILDQFVTGFAFLDSLRPFGATVQFSILDLILTLLLLSVVVGTFIPVARRL